MDLKSRQSLPQKFLSSEMRSDGSPTTTTALGCDLGTLLSFSCRTRAEDFARTLNIKLKTLGSFESLENGPPLTLNLVEPPWKALSLDSHLNRQKQMVENTVKLNPNGMTNSKCSGTVNPTETSTGSEHQLPIDSDIYYDFDMSSPGSPDERGSCYNVINSCDDLYCSDCLRPNDSSSGGGGSDGLESGCIFTSPETLSPNSEPLDLLPDVFSIQHSNSAEDCRSDTSDVSIYYDVEPWSEAVPVPNFTVTEPLEIPEPKVTNPIPILVSKPKESPVTTVDEMKQLLNTMGSFGEGMSSGSEDEDSGVKIPRVMRWSSLKTGKTPPGTPGKKKIVRFADALGLDLAAVRTFLDEVPRVPKSAFRDLDYPLEPFSLTPPPSQKSAVAASCNKILVPTFHQPVSRPDFFDRIRDNKVFLESAYFSDNFTIKGAVRVMNMDFHKSVYIRYTYDEWKTFTDFQATYINGSCDGFSDLFEFTIHVRSDLVEVGSRVILAVRFHCKGEQFWDNNCGNDYLFHCVMGTSSGPSPSPYTVPSVYPSMYGTSPDDPWTNHMWF